MKLTEQDGLRILTPDTGQWLYKDDNGNRIFSDCVYLGKYDSSANWGECANEQKEQWEAEYNENIEE